VAVSKSGGADSNLKENEYRNVLLLFRWRRWETHIAEMFRNERMENSHFCLEKRLIMNEEVGYKKILRRLKIQENIWINLNKSCLIRQIFISILLYCRRDYNRDNAGLTGVSPRKRKYQTLLYYIISYRISYQIYIFKFINEAYIYYIILYYIVTYRIVSYHIVSYHIISYHIISYHISYRIYIILIYYT